VEVVIFQDSLNVLKRKTRSRQFCSKLKAIKLEIPAKHKKGIVVFPPAPGNRYITDILNIKVNNEPFFEKKDSLHIMTQNLNLKKIEIDKEILKKLNSTSFEKEMVKRKNGKQYNFYNMKIPVFSIDKKKAYVELEHRCGSLCGNGSAIFLKKFKENGKLLINGKFGQVKSDRTTAFMTKLLVFR